MTTKDMGDNIGPCGTSKFCNDILNGKEGKQAYPRAIQAIFKELDKANPTMVNKIITLEDFKDTMRQWKEFTSTSGQHLGHCISLITKIGDNTNKLDEKIISLHHKMLVIVQQGTTIQKEKVRSLDSAGERTWQPKN
jgi:hypothetical protein